VRFIAPPPASFPFTFLFFLLSTFYSLLSRAAPLSHLLTRKKARILLNLPVKTGLFALKSPDFRHKSAKIHLFYPENNQFLPKNAAFYH